MRAVTTVGVLCLFVVATTASQTRPDFSGRWARVEQNVPASIPQTLTVRQTSRDTSVTGVKMAEPYVTIEVDRHFDQRFESSQYTVGVVGGTVGGVSRSGAPPSTTRHATKWQGRELVIETGSSCATPERPEPRTTTVTYRRVSR